MVHTPLYKDVEKYESSEDPFGYSGTLSLMHKVKTVGPWLVFEDLRDWIVFFSNTNQGDKLKQPIIAQFGALYSDTKPTNPLITIMIAVHCHDEHWN